jgi:hypothetical protein
MLSGFQNASRIPELRKRRGMQHRIAALYGGHNRARLVDVSFEVADVTVYRPVRRVAVAEQGMYLVALVRGRKREFVTNVAGAAGNQ